MLNWVKANRKAMNAGKLKPERMELFQRLLAIIEQRTEGTGQCLAVA
jgi:hypothetical protein